MSKIIFTGLILPCSLFFGLSDPGWCSQSNTNGQSANGTLQKMIIDNGSVTMTLDLNAFNGSTALVTRPVTLNFAAATNSFFPILVFNDVLRSAEEGSITLVAQSRSAPLLPPALVPSLKQLVIEKLPADAGADLVVRDARTGLTLFKAEGHLYDYNADARLLTIHGGRLRMSEEFANALGRPSDAGAIVGNISVGAVMQPIEVQTVVNGETTSLRMPALHEPRVGSIPGPDVIVGDLPSMEQFGSAGTQVGLAIGTTSCNAGTEDLDWFALPQTDHPVIPQNFYRMSGGATNDERFEQIGQSWLKHAFTALTQNACNFGCNGVGGSHLGSGCSDPYSANLNGGQSGIGSRAWVNPFTGAYPSTANNHSGHTHDGVSHRIRVEVDDLNQTLNQGATYFAEAQYVTPHEYAWCQAHPGQCNMYNNASYRQFSVSGTTSFSFGAVGSTVWRRPAIAAWSGTGANVSEIEPDPGNDGIWFIGYKVTNPSAGVWHYEYALHNENLDRAIQSFSVPIAVGTNISNIGFHAPPQEPGWANDGTFNNQGYSSEPWSVIQAADSITWNSKKFADDQNANAIRWGTLYNFRFDADQPPQGASATVGYFKTGSPTQVAIEAPGGTGTPTPTATPTATPSATPAGTPSVTPTSTPTPTPPFGTPTPRPTPTARPEPTSRPRPTVAPRPVH